MNQGYIYGKHAFHMTENHLLLFYLINKKMTPLLLDLNSQKTLSFKMFANNLSDFYLTPIVGSNENEFISYRFPDEILAWEAYLDLMEGSLKEKIKSIINWVKEHPEHKNPILLMYEPKSIE